MRKLKCWFLLIKHDYLYLWNTVLTTKKHEINEGKRRNILKKLLFLLLSLALFSIILISTVSLIILLIFVVVYVILPLFFNVAQLDEKVFNGLIAIIGAIIGGIFVFMTSTNKFNRSKREKIENCRLIILGYLYKTYIAFREGDPFPELSVSDELLMYSSNVIFDRLSSIERMKSTLDSDMKKMSFQDSVLFLIQYIRTEIGYSKTLEAIPKSYYDF